VTATSAKRPCSATWVTWCARRFSPSWTARPPFVANIGGGWLKDAAVRAAWDPKAPLGRMAKPYQIEPLALYLASDASSYMTGSQVGIDGGFMIGAHR